MIQFTWECEHCHNLNKKDFGDFDDATIHIGQDQGGGFYGFNAILVKHLNL